MVSVNWYWNRLRIMSGRELAVRVCRLAGDLMPALPVPVVALNIAPVEEGFRQAHARHFPSGLQKAVEAAESILSGKVVMFGDEISLPQPIDWHRDFVTGKDWPNGNVNYRKQGIGDPKIIWELNRQQFLVPLGKAFFLTGEEKYATRAIELMLSWIRQESSQKGINWASMIELTLRQISWIWCLRFVARSLNEEARRTITEAMLIQTRRIAGHLSLYSSANNHLISELTAMMMAGDCLDKSGWMETSARLLEQQIERQILPDGSGAEQSTSYLADTLEYYLLSALVLRRRGDPIPDKILDGLRHAVRFLHSILGAPPFPLDWGDNDSGQVLCLGSAYSKYKTLLNLTAFLTGDMQWITPDVEQDEKTFWLVGPEEFERLIAACPKTAVPAQHAFPDGGYYLLEDAGRRISLAFDCGPLGMKPTAGHGHCDMLSFVLSINGKPFCIDPGTYTYFGSRWWRNYFRGASAHNTIRVDGREQADFSGEFLCLTHPNCECTEWVEGKRVSGRHQGYRRLGVIHSRTLTLGEAAARIDDHLETAGRHLIELFFHFDSGCVVRENTDGYQVSNSGETVRLRLDNRLERRLYYGNDVLPLGWQSHRYCEKEKTFTIVGRAWIDGSNSFVTELSF